ncbi:MAG: 3-hydroxyisobutyryl-CoA hydrolase [Paracoccaceae bacterium]
MNDISIRKEGHAGRITLQRPDALNAVTHEMCLAIEQAFDAWREDDEVALILLDAEGERAFCAGGDIAKLYETGRAGDFGYGQTFWADEYRLNAKIFTYPKPVVSFLQGFTMGGGVGIGCHGTHRIVGDSSKISMPECGIGLVPDVGGTLMLALAPGRLGEYLGLTGARMNAGDAIHIGFADHYIPETDWETVKATLTETGTVDASLDQWSQKPVPGPIANAQNGIDALFKGLTLHDMLIDLRMSDSDFAKNSLEQMRRNAPLSMACTVDIIRRLKNLEKTLSIEKALDLEYRFTFRAMEKGDFLEGIRAQIIDKDRNPQWQYPDMAVPMMTMSQMLFPLKDAALTFKKDQT